MILRVSDAGAVCIASVTGTELESALAATVKAEIPEISGLRGVTASSRTGVVSTPSRAIAGSVSVTRATFEPSIFSTLAGPGLLESAANAAGRAKASNAVEATAASNQLRYVLMLIPSLMASKRRRKELAGRKAAAEWR